jgi:hypothetical protein
MDSIWYIPDENDDRTCSVCSFSAHKRTGRFSHAVELVRDDESDENFIVHESCDLPEDEPEYDDLIDSEIIFSFEPEELENDD